MKTLSNALIILSMAIIFPQIIIAQHELPVRVASVPFSSQEITIDGNDDEMFWSDTLTIDEMFNSMGVTGNADFSGYIKLCYDHDNLYLYVNITDDIEHSYEGIGSWWEYDNVEVFLDLDTSITNETGGYIGDEAQFRYNRGSDTTNGVVPRNDASLDNFAIINGVTGWQVEAAIPWLSFMPEGSLPEDFNAWIETALGFDIQIADNDGNGRDGQGAWDADEVGSGATEDNAWHNTRTFGIIELLSVSTAPRAIAGNNQSVNEDSLVTLDGTKSRDFQNDSLYYSWVSPDGITLSDSTSKTPTFYAPQVRATTNYNFVLTVNDGTNYSLPDTVVITVIADNMPPLADAGPDQVVLPNEIVTLSGSLSSDPEGDELNYSWTSLDGIELSGSETITPVFVSPKINSDEIYKFTLVVNDGEFDSDPDTVIVAVDGYSSVKNNTLSNVKISPNPAKDYITVEIDDAVSQALTLTLFDISGKQIYTTNLIQDKTRINLAGLELSSVLIVQLENKLNNRKYNQKIIVE